MYFLINKSYNILYENTDGSYKQKLYYFIQKY